MLAWRTPVCTATATRRSTTSPLALRASFSEELKKLDEAKADGTYAGQYPERNVVKVEYVRP